MRVIGLGAAAALGLALLNGGGALAAACVTDYSVDLSIYPLSSGPPAMVSGDICTDGTIGTLAASDIASWDLTLSDSFNPQISTFTLDSSLSTATLNLYLSGVTSPLSATSTQLIWTFEDPGNPNYAILQFGDSSSNNFIAWYDYDYADNPIIDNSFGNSYTSASYGTTQSGPQDIGTLPAPVPEPASLPLLAIGLLGLATLRRHQRP